jgi:hypothetical protein
LSTFFRAPVTANYTFMIATDMKSQVRDKEQQSSLCLFVALCDKLVCRSL